MKKLLFILLVLCLFVTACTPGPKKPDQTPQIIETDILRIVVTGDVTTITILETGATCTITKKRVLRRKTDNPQTQQTAVDNDIFQVMTCRGVLVIIEKQTGEIYLI